MSLLVLFLATSIIFLVAVRLLSDLPEAFKRKALSAGSFQP
jgi:hypothetical protein